jgi:thrombospondin type 3 repeat protein
MREITVMTSLSTIGKVGVDTRSTLITGQVDCQRAGAQRLCSPHANARRIRGREPRRSKLWVLLTLTCFTLLASSWAGASPLAEADLSTPGDGLITRDVDTGLDWLDVSATSGLSYANITAGGGGWAALGFRHATASEVCALLAGHAFVPASGCPTGNVAVTGSLSSELHDRVESFVSLLGVTTCPSGCGSFDADLVEVEGWFDDELGTASAGRITLYYAVASSHTAVGVRTAVAPKSFSALRYGNWLVREATSNEVHYRVQGTVTRVENHFGLLPLLASVGDPLIFEFSFDSDAADTQTSVSFQGRYPVISFEVTLRDDPPVAVTSPLIATQSAPFSDLWGIQGCLPSCASATYDEVRLNFFLPPGSVPSDALTLPPIPPPPGTTVQFGFFSADFPAGETSFIEASLVLAPPDGDDDGVADVDDNCPTQSNPDQGDTDHDGTGDACDTDDDGDGFADGADNCPLVANPSQADGDGDGIGNACDGDLDGDGLSNELDNCPAASNADQTDTDHDGLGDECDTDDDSDGLQDADDNCPALQNPDQDDLDGDNIGDVCDSDLDGDGVENTGDNCPIDSNLGQDNTDGDSFGDVCDPDADNDTVANASDNCPLVANPNQADSDNDGAGNACDSDLDGDGVANGVDNCPVTANSGQTDFDGDGQGDACDGDADGDGVDDDADECAATPNDAVTDPMHGCSTSQLCPCEGPRGTVLPWRNHGKYMSCVAHAAGEFESQGLISEFTRSQLVSAAAQSSCGQ